MQANPTHVLALPLSGRRANQNERTQPRHTLAFNVSLTDDPAMQMSGINLSPGGMLCTAATPLWPGNVQRFTVHVKDAQIEVRGQVMELVPHGEQVAMRVRFEGASDAV